MSRLETEAVKIAQYYKALAKVVQSEQKFDNETLKNIAYACCLLYNKATGDDIDILDYMSIQLKCVVQGMLEDK